MQIILKSIDFKEDFIYEYGKKEPVSTYYFCPTINIVVISKNPLSKVASLENTLIKRDKFDNFEYWISLSFKDINLFNVNKIKEEVEKFLCQ